MSPRQGGRLRDSDPAVAALVEREAGRQRDGLELIASENVVSEAVLETLGSTLTNKYAEGYPGRRWYSGCEVVDELETLAVERAKALFGAEHANVQVHSGTQANLVAYGAVLEPGDGILSMDSALGGHVSHGAAVSAAGSLYDVATYGLGSDERIDYDEVFRLAVERRPKLLVAGASLYTRVIDWGRFREAADACGALLLVDMAHVAGLVAAGEHPSPVPFADIVNTTTHKTLRGPRGGLLLCRNRLAERVDAQVFPGMQGGPLMHVVAGKAVCFGEAMTPAFQRYQQSVKSNAAALAQCLAEGGARLVSGGTDNHMVLLDLEPLGWDGKEAERALERAGITTNGVRTPLDVARRRSPSGLRVGTAAVTTRGMGAGEMRAIAGLVLEILASRGNAETATRVREEVRDLCRSHPVYAPARDPREIET